MPSALADPKLHAVLARGMHHYTVAVPSPQVFRHPASCRAPISHGAVQEDAGACLGWVPTAALSPRTALAGKC